VKLAGLVAALTLACSTTLFAEGESDKQVEAHKVVLDLAGAFSNAEFKIRDGHWSGALKPKENAIVAVNLYAGNQYWFSAGVSDPGRKLEIAIYDETGKIMPSEEYSDSSRAAAGFSPTTSGQYYISISLADGAESTYCLVYSYK
jgi:hypothetical protein